MQRAKPKRPHSFGGCSTCRKRHLRCDQTTPKCNRCERSNLPCDFAPALRWIVSTGPEVLEQEQSDNASIVQAHTKQHLYTEDARRRMGATIVNAIPSTVSHALDSIEESLLSNPGGTTTISVGPFGAFETVPTLFAPEVHTSHADIPECFLEKHDATDDFVTNSLDCMQWDDLFQWDLDVFTVNINQLDPFQTSAGIYEAASENGERNTQVNIDGSDPLWPALDLVTEAPLLLKHFNDEVITQMGSLPINEKSAWRILNFPSAVFTLSQLSTLAVDKGNIKHANLANFFALIGASALHLSVSPVSKPGLSDRVQDWASLANRTYAASKHHLKMTLENECTLPCKAKYKDQLMAVGAVLATALLSGNHVDGRKYLVEMERLIRYRGLIKPSISRRARLLHNVYAWMRIMSESTNVLHIEQSAADLAAFPTTFETESSRAQERQHTALDDFLYLETYQTPPELRDLTPQRNSEGQLDLHLTSPFVDRDGMVMQIYGVPETWLRLVSQTTRLANILDNLNPATSSVDAQSFALLQSSRSSALESAICTFKTRFQVDPVSASPHSQMLQALSGALVVFFYRRVKGIQPLMLQDSVNQVITSLHAFDHALEAHSMPGPGTAWPAFVAGAEALSQQQRADISAWLDKAHSKSGWKGYATSQKVLSELWKQRDADDGTSGVLTWMGVCKQLHCWPLLC